MKRQRLLEMKSKNDIAKGVDEEQYNRNQSFLEMFMCKKKTKECHNGECLM